MFAVFQQETGSIKTKDGYIQVTDVFNGLSVLSRFKLSLAIWEWGIDQFSKDKEIFKNLMDWIHKNADKEDPSVKELKKIRP